MNTQFKKGNIPWNKGTKGVMKPNKTSFKKGQRVGAKNNTWKGGVQTISNDCVHLYAGVGKRVRRPRKVWEDHHGEIPDGMMVWHIDGDKHNDDIDNLELVTRAEMAHRNR